MPEWIGKTIGKVRIDKYLARGGMAEVYLGFHLSLERPVAVKVLHSYIEEDPGLMARFQREARVVAGLRHPNIVQIFDFDAMEGHPYIVMEYLKGPTLSTYLRGLHERNERIPTHQVARLLKSLTSALDYAHGQGMIHRDIKPGNIMLHSIGDVIPLDRPLTNEVDAVLTDFGLVRIEHAASQTASGMVSGTPSYMSPEQARGDKTDHRTDIYSLGVVLYEMLAGRVPFEADTSMSVIYMQINEPPPPVPGVNPAVQEVMNRALAKNPNDRYQTCREMAVDFFLALDMTAEAETIVESMPNDSISKQTMAVVSAKPKNTKPQRKPIWIGVAVLSALCLIVAAFVAVRVFSKISSPPTSTETPSIINTEPAATDLVTLPVAGPPSSDGMVKMPAGSYEVGITPPDDYHSATTTVDLPDFWVDIYQITNAQYQQYIDATNAQAPEIWPGENDHPVRGVTWDQANAYCSWVNKRLLIEAEWEAVGRGPGIGPQLYPWGTDPTAGGKTFGMPDQDTYAVGTQPFNVSPSGIFDLVGNVWEWVDKPYNSIQDGYKILRGGRFGLPQDLAYRLAVAPDDTRFIKFAGFRCAADQVK
ncbi:MAG: bifunctional serine/threonine-protein kinase/formylglycine-generating enzyme family protein [Chloroflexota bacterium]